MLWCCHVLSITSSHLSGRAIAAVPPAECSDTPKILFFVSRGGFCMLLHSVIHTVHILPMSELDAATNLPQALSTIHQNNWSAISTQSDCSMPLKPINTHCHCELCYGLCIYISACASAHQVCNQTLHLQGSQSNKCCAILTFVCEVKRAVSYHQIGRDCGI